MYEIKQKILFFLLTFLSSCAIFIANGEYRKILNTKGIITVDNYEKANKKLGTEKL